MDYAEGGENREGTFTALGMLSLLHFLAYLRMHADKLSVYTRP